VAIVSSVFVLGPEQASGLRYCTEIHYDGDGDTHIVEYLSTMDADNNAIMLGRATALTADMKSAELHKAVFDAPWDYVLTESTTLELAAYVRELYRYSSGDELALISKRVIEWVTNGRFTEDQISGAIGMTAEQWVYFKNKMLALTENYNAVLTAVGE